MTPILRPQPAPARRWARLGTLVAMLALIADQASKYWLLAILGIEARGAIAVTPFLDFVLAWNKGISYGWFQAHSEAARALLIILNGAAIVVLMLWLRRTTSGLAAIALGLIIGGAIGNVIDRVIYGAVVDFIALHAEIGGRTYTWYIFNLADVAIVAGVIGILYETLVTANAAKAP